MEKRFTKLLGILLFITLSSFSKPVRITFHNVTNQCYVVESSFDLTNWFFVVYIQNPTPISLLEYDVDDADGFSFWRLRSVTCCYGH